MILIIILSKRLNSFIWPIDGNITDTATLDQSEPGSNSTEEVLHIHESSRTRASPSDGLSSYSGHLMVVGGLTPLYRYRWCILQTLLIGLGKDGFMVFFMALVQRERQTASFRIWTQVANSIFYVDNFLLTFGDLCISYLV